MNICDTVFMIHSISEECDIFLLRFNQSSELSVISLLMQHPNCVSECFLFLYFCIKTPLFVTVALKKLLFKTLLLLNGNCLRHPIPGKWMRALVPNLVFARHHGLLFGLPFLRVVGFFNEHFDPTQVWRWCLRDPGEKKKKEEEEKEKTYPILC